MLMIWQAFNGFVIGGGDNIGAEIYKGDLTLDVEIDPDRDRLELEVLQVAEQAQLPVLGFAAARKSSTPIAVARCIRIFIAAYENVPRMWTPLPSKQVSVEDGTALHQIMRQTRFRANSLHRQSIDRLGNGLRVSARPLWHHSGG
jgi:putative glutamine amidotransferase